MFTENDAGTGSWMSRQIDTTST